MINKRYRIGFIIEQVLGHVAHSENLRELISNDDSVEASWGEPEWAPPGILGKVPNWTLRAGIQARKAISEMFQLDVLFFHTQTTATLSQDWLERIPSIISLDATPRQFDALGEHYRHTKRTEWLESWKFRLDRSCFQKAQSLVTWSQWAKDSLVDDYDIDPEKISVIPPGVNVKEWSRPDGRNGDNNTVKILFVGSDLKRKGGYDLLKAVRNLQNEQNLDGGTRPDIQLHLVTKENLPEESGLHIYNDLQPNSPTLKQLYHECDIFCLPTYGDCLPMVLSEASAAGMPIISTAVAAVPEIVCDGETGYLVPVGDVRSLRDAIRKLSDDPALRHRFGEDALGLVERSHDAERNTNLLLDLLKQTAAGMSN